MKKYLIAIYYLMAFTGSAAVTYLLPGTEQDVAFIDIMGILLSLIFLGFGITYGIARAIKDLDNSTSQPKKDWS